MVFSLFLSCNRFYDNKKYFITIRSALNLHLIDWVMLALRHLLLVIVFLGLQGSVISTFAEDGSLGVTEITTSEDAAVDLEEEEEEDDEDEDEDFGDEIEFDTGEIVYDPLSGYNRFVTHVNDKFYFWLLEPVASGYEYVTPKPVRSGLDNFFENLLFPVRFINNLLQFKFKGAAVELSRFTINTTVGLAGFFDPAKSWLELEPYSEDLGQTLGFYGVGSGFHFVLPLLGPSNLRDSIGLVGDYPLTPSPYLENLEQQLIYKSVETVNWTSLHLGEYESLKKDALDFYPFIRDIYEQNRQNKIEK